MQNIAYFNCNFIPKEEIKISPDDRGFLFGDGIYEVMKWYGSFFFDEAGHTMRLKRSLREIRIKWEAADTFPSFSTELVRRNELTGKHALLYLQVTRGVAPRNHSFPEPETDPTVYAFIREIAKKMPDPGNGVSVMLKKEIRWSRCDIKSIALLANVLSIQEACDKGMKESVFVRDGYITEGSRSNFFLVRDNTLYTHPANEHILAGITRNNIIRYADECGITIREEPYPEKELGKITEAFLTNTSAEITPVTRIDDTTVGNGSCGPVTFTLIKKFCDEIASAEG